MAKIELKVCPLCGGDEKESFAQKGDRQILRCKSCGLAHVDPQPGPDDLYALYNERYFESEKFGGDTCIGYRSYIDERPLLLESFGKKLNFIKNFKKKGRILDIGCGYGFFLEVAEKGGFEAKGVDVSSYAVEYAKKHGLDAFSGTLSEAKFPDSSFDVVTIFEVIEHLPNPLNELKEVFRILKPDGLVLITTPNEDGCLRKLMGKNLFAYRHQEHLCFFSQKTMRNLLQRVGFEKIGFIPDQVRTYPLRHFLGLVKYFFKNPALNKLANLARAALGPLPEFRVPFPRDTLVVYALKPKGDRLE